MIRRRPGSADGEEASYLASVSDLMANLVYVFIITVVVFALQLAHAQSRAENQGESFKREEQRYTAVPKSRGEIVRLMKARLAERGLEVEIDEQQGVLRLSGEGILFPFGEDAPVDRHLPNVGKLAAALSDVVPAFLPVAADVDQGQGTIAEGRRPAYCADLNPGTHSEPVEREFSGVIETVLIEGHTDAVRTRIGGRFRNNVDLSAARAWQVLDLMSTCEPQLLALHNQRGQQVFSVSGYGETRLLPDTASEDDENRRIEIRFIMEPEWRASAEEPPTAPVADEVDERYESKGDSDK